MNFIEVWRTLEGATVTVYLEHRIFGSQQIFIENLHIIEDDNRIGVRVKDQEIYLNKEEIISTEICDNMYIVLSKNMKIVVVC